jgi:hypothetical protein
VDCGLAGDWALLPIRSLIPEENNRF